MLIEAGDTKVLCTASVEEGVPAFLKGKGQGWLTAEYGMLPRATNTRTRREAADGRQSGRTQEIQRLIGRSLRAVTDLTALGERTIKLDCDVLQADGGTRCASITGACVALHDAFRWCRAHRLVAGKPLRDFVAAVSVGIVDGVPLLDLDYAEDSACDTDMNVVMTGAGGFVELQGTAEGAPFTRDEMDALVALAEKGHARADRGAESRAGWMTTALSIRAPRARVGQRRQTARIPAAAGAAGHRGDRASGARHRRGRRAACDVRRECARQGAARERACEVARAGRRFRPLRGALGGAPGVQCARYAGEPRSDARNNAKLIAALAGVADRRAHYACVLALVRHADDPEPIIAEGAWHGTIIDAARGTGGFGYDPHFEDGATGMTGAELPLDRKNERSHRGKAMRALIERLQGGE